MAALSVPAASALAAGFQFINVPANADGPGLKGAIWYPCAEPVAKIELGRIVLPGVKNCAIAGDKLSLVVISHGGGGDFIGHRDLAETLADGGFVVAAINHPGDTVSDMSRSNDLSVFVERPTDIKRLTDFLLSNPALAARIDQQRIGFFGFSRGGDAGLILIGADPDWDAATGDICWDAPPIVCEQVRNEEHPSEPLPHDTRIKAVVIADPVTAKGLSGVMAPVQLWASERGGDGVTPESVAALNAELRRTTNTGW